MSKKLEGKVAIVTGASKGIGAAIATRLASEGASVVVNYASSKEGAGRVVDAIVKDGGRAIAIQADVANADEVERLFVESKRVYGRLDALVNNAGVFEFQPLEAVDDGHFRRQFDLNVHAVFLTSQKALAYFDRAGGSIVNLSSSSSIAPFPHSSVYAASKGAIDAMTRALSKELGARGIRVNAVSPGPTETERAKEMGLAESDQGKAMIQQTPLGRFGQPGDIAAVVLFLASEEARWVTGQIIQVSGGLFLG
jgi:3-oxoacyl-[acyl-carrier protein] reductase